jgi:putative transposase
MSGLSAFTDKIPSQPGYQFYALNGEIFFTLQEAKVLVEAWRRHYNTVRPHSSLGYRPPAPKVLLWPPPPAALKGAAPATAKPARPPCN